jgi:predicted secreted hydrolase
MKVEYLHKKGTTNSRIKGILSLLIITAMITPIVPVQAEIKTGDDHPEAYWKHYPYHPPETDIIFPSDEGAHDTAQFPIEWWYANFHLTGQTTGQEYGSFVAFYKIQSTVAEKKEVRIFSISDIQAEETYTNAQIGTLTASNDHLDLSFAYIINDFETENQAISTFDNKDVISENQEKTMNTEYTETDMKSTNQSTTMHTTYSDTIQRTNTIGNCEIDHQESFDELIQYDHWYTKSNEQGLIPFQYTLIVGGNSQQDSKPMQLVVDIDCLKKPLIVGGDGFIDLGNGDFSYYYCLTKLIVTGTISFHGFTEEVLGNAWIDHQWGNFVNQNPPPWGLIMTYEWFSIQLNDNREIVVGDMWDRETGEKVDQSYTDGLNLLNSDGSLEILKDYTITPLAFWNDTTDERFYSCQWHITETSRAVDLIVTPVFLNQVMRFKENYQLLQQVLEELFPGACFWEGVCTVSGTIKGISVDGKSCVELTHCYERVEK